MEKSWKRKRLNPITIESSEKQGEKQAIIDLRYKRG